MRAEWGKDLLQKALRPHFCKQAGLQLAQVLAAGDQVCFAAPLDVAAGNGQILVLQQAGHDAADVHSYSLSIRKKRGGQIDLRVEIYAEDTPPLFGQ